MFNEKNIENAQNPVLAITQCRNSSVHNQTLFAILYTIYLLQPSKAKGTCNKITHKHLLFIHIILLFYQYFIILSTVR